MRVVCIGLCRCLGRFWLGLGESAVLAFLLFAVSMGLWRSVSCEIDWLTLIVLFCLA